MKKYMQKCVQLTQEDLRIYEDEGVDVQVELQYILNESMSEVDQSGS